MPKMQPTPAHDYAKIFPLYEGPLLDELSERIAMNGQREDIVLLNGLILDGRRREAACMKAGITPRYRQFGSRKEDGKDPLEFVIDTNLHRRQLSEGDQVLAAARYAKAKTGGNRHGPSAQNEQMEPEPTNKAAAEKFKVSEQKLRRGKTIVARGVPELQEAVASGEVTVSNAAKIAMEEPEVQRQAVDDVKTGKAKTATESVEKRKPNKSKSSKSCPFDREQIPAKIGLLRSSLTKIAKTCGVNKNQVECLELLEKFVVAFNRWKLAS